MRGDGGLTYTGIWLTDVRDQGLRVTNCVESTPGYLSTGLCPVNYPNSVSITENTGKAQDLKTLLYSHLALNTVTTGQTTSLDFPVAPLDEFQDHTITWALGSVVYGSGYAGSFSQRGDVITESAPPWPSVTCTRKATPVKFILTPDTIDFSDVPVASSQILTLPLNFSIVTAPATLPAATLMFSHADVDDGKLVLNGGRVSFQRVSDGSTVRLNEPFRVTGKKYGFHRFSGRIHRAGRLRRMYWSRCR